MSNDAKTKEKVRIAVFFGLCILLVAGIFVSIGSGTVSLSVSETWAALLGEADADTNRIVNLIRLPRTIVTVLVGANLALAGCNLQGVLHNPLADPGIIGVSAGAGLFAMVIMLLFPEQSAMVPLAAFVGAVLSTGIVFFLAWEKGINPLRMILAGVAGSNRRMVCGTMRPTKPSMPATLTETAASSAERKIKIVRIRITRTPRLLANSSPNCNAFRERAHKIVPIMPIAL